MKQEKAKMQRGLDEAMKWRLGRTGARHPVRERHRPLMMAVIIPLVAFIAKLKDERMDPERKRNRAQLASCAL